jgi:hypothetical protein
MGNEHNKAKKKKNKNNDNLKDDMVLKISCPFCSKVFKEYDSIRFNSHTKQCGLSLSKKLNKMNKVKPCQLYPPAQYIQLNESIFKNQKSYLDNLTNSYDEKDFEKKIQELRTFLYEKQKGFEDGNETLKVDRQNLLEDTKRQIKNRDVFKEWKIDFTGEVSFDAGGLLREFFTNVFKNLESNDLKLFVQSDNSEISYIFNPFLFPNEENLEYCKLIGVLMAKSLLQNVTINLCFNKLIYKMILQEKVTYEDLVFIDSSIYNSLNNLKENIVLSGNDDIIKELDFDYTIEMKDSSNKVHSFELVENGSKKKVENLDDLIEKRINFLIGMYEPFVKAIRDTLFTYIPPEKLKCFSTNELELIFNGRPFIDVEEWKSCTSYKEPYYEQHQVIKWFWEILEVMPQKQLSNLLLFSTGNSRVPLGGFAELESNRGALSPFRIDYVPYTKNCKNYIKAHTCFNRIDLPCYETRKELEEMVKFVSENEFWGFGIE